MRPGSPTIARERLPDRPEFADRLRQRGLSEAEARVASMRQSEVEELARNFRGQGRGGPGQPLSRPGSATAARIA